MHKPSEHSDLIFIGFHSFVPQENVALNNAVYFNAAITAWGYICIIFRQYTAKDI